MTPLSINSRLKSLLIFSFIIPHPVHSSMNLIPIIRCISVRRARNGVSWPVKYNSIDYLPLVNEWLERSASLPLTIRLEDHWGWVDDDDKMINILNEVTRQGGMIWNSTSQRVIYIAFLVHRREIYSVGSFSALLSLLCPPIFRYSA